METMAHGGFLLAVVIIAAVTGLAVFFCGYKAVDDFDNEERWVFAGLASATLTVALGCAAMLSIILNVIRYAKGG